MRRPYPPRAAAPSTERPAEAAPGVVAAIRELPRRAGRYAVEVGGGTVAPVSVETIADLALAVGRTLDPPALARLRSASAITRCYDHALDALARRARASGELARWLAERDHPREAVTAAIGRLQALGLLDDARFADAYVHGPARSRGFGARRIAAELRRRGVAGAVVSAALGEREATSGEAAAVEAAARRRARALATLAPDVAQRRLSAWLVRRGFSPGAAVRAARVALERA